MIPQGNPVRFLQIFGLLMAASFPLLSGIPVLGYIAETGAIFGIIFLAYRRDWFWLIIGAAGSLMLATFLYGSELFIIATWARVVIPSAAFGLFWAVGGHPSRAFAVAVVLAAISSLVIFGSERDLIYKALDQVKGLIMTAGAGSSQSGGATSDFVEGVAGMIEVVKRLMPSLLALSAAFQIFAGWLLLMVILHQIGEFVPRVTGFYFWKMPDFYLLLFGAALLVRLLAGETLQMVADNVILFMGMFYAAFGFSVFEYYLKKVRLSLFMRIMFYIGIILLQVPGLILAALVGLCDSYFDFRKVRARMIG